jgi:hypothetical protein
MDGSRRGTPVRSGSRDGPKRRSSDCPYDVIVDGSPRHYISTRFRIRTFDGEERIAGISVDVTRLLSAQRSLEDTQRQLATAERMACLGSWWEDETTAELNWSPGLRALLEVPDNRGEVADRWRYWCRRSRTGCTGLTARTCSGPGAGRSG